MSGTTNPHAGSDRSLAVGALGDRSLAARSRAIVTKQETIVFGVLIALVLAFALLRPANFATPGNAQNLTRDAAILLILSVGITYVTILGVFDLSIGGVLVFSQVLAVKAMGTAGGNGLGTIFLGALVAVAVGAAGGLLNGVLVSRLRLSPFIVTLATFGASLGAADLVTGGSELTSVPMSLSTFIGVDRVGGLPVVTVIALVIAIAGGVQLAKSRFGRHTYAIGSSRDATRRVGVNDTRHVLFVYILVGVLSGVAGFLDAGRFGTTSIGGHNNDALAAITAVALGGASLSGGRGTMLGTVIGVSIPAVLQNGLIILGTQPYWYQIIVAAALIVSIYLDRLKNQPNPGQ